MCRRRGRAGEPDDDDEDGVDDIDWGNIRRTLRRVSDEVAEAAFQRCRTQDTDGNDCNKVSTVMQGIAQLGNLNANEAERLAARVQSIFTNCPQSAGNEARNVVCRPGVRRRFARCLARTVRGVSEKNNGVINNSSDVYKTGIFFLTGPW